MKLTCSQAQLNKHLSTAIRVVPNRPQHPILACIKLEALPEGKVVITGFDMAVSIQSSFSAIVETAGEIALPAKTFGELVSRLPEGEVTLEVGEEHSVTLTSVSGQYKVQGSAASEYVEIPKMNEGEVISIPAGVLREGLRGTITSASHDETKQVLNGVHVKKTEKGLEFAATDGHRVAVIYSQKLVDVPLETTIPLPAIKELNRVLAGRNEEETVSMRASTDQCEFKLDDFTLNTRILYGQYPRYEQLIPRQFQYSVTVDRRQLIASINRLSVFQDKNNIIQFALDVDNKLHLAVHTKDLGNGKETLSATVAGVEKEFKVAFNSKLLLDGLEILPTAEVKLQINHPTTPAVMVPIGNDSMEYLIMPIQMRD